MKKLVVLAALFTTFTAEAYFERRTRDMSLPSQKVVEKQTVSAPIAADADRLLNDQATTNTGPTEVTSFLAQPDVCRNITITPGGTTADVRGGVTVVTGVDVLGQTRIEAFEFDDNQSAAETGSLAFCSVSKVLFHAMDGASATFDVGVGDKLGMKRCMDGDHVVFAALGGAYESTRPTVASNTTLIGGNTVDLSSAYDGSSDVEIFFLQNFRCP